MQTQGASTNQAGGQQPKDPPIELKPVPPTPIAIKKDELDEPSWDPAWSTLIERSLPANLLSHRRARAVMSLCPRFRRLTRAERRQFWAYFFQALAGAEAGLKPTVVVHHLEPQVDVVDLVTHRRVRQEGLLQLTYMDSPRYGCSFDWAKDQLLPEHDPARTILQPKNNLLCGIRIVEDQLIKRHEPLLSSLSYWSTLRPDNPGLVVFKRQMANVPECCRIAPEGARREHRRARMMEASSPPRRTGTGTN